MKILKLHLFAFLLFGFVANAQSGYQQVSPPQVSDFWPSLQFLASPELEGREAGTRGADAAAGYIASQMQLFGLTPWRNANNESKTVLSDYFQPFAMHFSKVQSISLVVNDVKNKTAALNLALDKDFSLENTVSNLSLKAPMVFVGYGINAPALNFNDFENAALKGKVLLILEGYPGQHDTLSTAWKKFRKSAENDDFDLESRCSEAAKLGASAVIVINKQFLDKAYAGSTNRKPAIPKGLSFCNPANNYCSDTLIHSVPCFLLTETGSQKLSALLKTDLPGFEKLATGEHSIAASTVGLCKINLKVVPDSLHFNNVIGILKGADTSKTVILGAHYDHKGIREDGIYYGSDDNASGVAGLLALARKWTESHTVPPCNIMFASWTAEEKGLVGSEYYTAQLSAPEKVKFYINMDMISRSVKQDTAGRQLSIGTRPADETIRDIARNINSSMVKPFELDLWDVTGHSGSDYASFTAKNIPIMTYNTGLHDDYHTYRDIPARADLVKMLDVLKIVNGSLKAFLNATFPK